jgi:hypothetical protein
MLFQKNNGRGVFCIDSILQSVKELPMNVLNKIVHQLLKEKLASYKLKGLAARVLGFADCSTSVQLIDQWPCKPGFLSRLAAAP